MGWVRISRLSYRIRAGHVHGGGGFHTSAQHHEVFQVLVIREETPLWLCGYLGQNSLTVTFGVVVASIVFRTKSPPHLTVQPHVILQ